MKKIRSLPAPASVLAGGEAPAFTDQQSSLRSRLPWALLIAGGTTLVILFLLTGSLVLPIKTLVMNVLSLSATLGFLVLIFQDGRFEGLLHYTSQGALNATQPLLVGAIAFAVLLDATIVRALLVPSLMKMLGPWNWWAPGPLRRLHERIGLRETDAPPALGRE